MLSGIVLPCGSAGKESACNAGDLGSIPGLGRPSRERKGSPLQYSGLENPTDCVVQGVTKSRSDTTERLSLISDLTQEKKQFLAVKALKSAVKTLKHFIYLTYRWLQLIFGVSPVRVGP